MANDQKLQTIQSHDTGSKYYPSVPNPLSFLHHPGKGYQFCQVQKVQICIKLRYFPRIQTD